MISLVLFEKDAVVRRHIVELLAEMPDMGPVAEVAEGELLLVVCRRGVWDVAIVDLLAPGENAFGLVASLRRDCPDTPLIAVSFALERSHIALCQQLGVAGLVASEDMGDELQPALTAVLSGQPYGSAAVQEVLARDQQS